jgi:flagellar hook-associated protein 1 FlgK
MVDPALIADPSRLVVSGPGVAAGDRARPALMLDRLTGDAAMTPTDWTGRPGSSESLTVTGLARRLVGAVGARAAEAARLDEGQKVLAAAVEARLERASGVDIDREMARLVELQTTYAANARVLSAVREMLDALMRI